MTYNDKQLKLARDVMGNFASSVGGGYWVRLIEAEDWDEDGSPVGGMTVYEDEGPGDGTPHKVTEESVCRAFEKVVNKEFADLRKDLFKAIRDMWEAEDYLGEDGPGGDFETDDVIVQLAALDGVVYG